MSVLDNLINQYTQEYALASDTPSMVIDPLCEQLQKTRKFIAERSCQEIHFSQPILSLRGDGIIFPNTIAMVQGQKGVHKSRLTENICAAFLSKNPTKNFIGFKAAPFKQYVVVYADTERNIKDQFPAAIQRIKMLAGYDRTESPPNLDFISLLEIERKSRFEALKSYMQDLRSRFPKEMIVVVLDVMTDCGENFNDPRESLKLIDFLNVLINQQDITFICVIHENPSSSGESKARGHTGTEATNKASTVMQISLERGANGVITDLIALKFLHTRNTKRPETHYLRYSEEAKSLVVADGEFVHQQKSLKAEKAALPALKDWLEETLTDKKSRETLLSEVQAAFQCSKRTAEERLKSLEEEDFLKKEKDGKQVFYLLEVVPF